MDNTRCTVLVNSCDAYEDTWIPFFSLLKKNWVDIPYPIVLNTESKCFSFPGLDIKTFQLFHQKKVPWGKRLIETLKRIDSEYIIFMLDDFFLLDTVDQKRIEECMHWMDEDKNIAVFSFVRTHQPNIQDNRYPYFELRPQDGEYRLNCQAAIWRKDLLISYIRPHESPWEWEILGSRRSLRYNERFYSLIEGCPQIMMYDYLSGGGVHRGKWVPNVQSLFTSNNIAIDLSKRGFITNEVAISTVSPKANLFTKIKRRTVGRINEKWREFLSLR